jgi:hypothetical protein
MAKDKRVVHIVSPGKKKAFSSRLECSNVCQLSQRQAGVWNQREVERVASLAGDEEGAAYEDCACTWRIANYSILRGTCHRIPGWQAAGA